MGKDAASSPRQATDITKILAIVNRRIQMRYAQELPAIGVKFGLMGYLMAIHNNPGLSQEEIAAKMAVEKSSVAKAVKQLVADGYVDRTVNPKSRREYILVPTAKAKAAHGRLLAVKARVHAGLTRNMTDIERDLFLRLLEKIPLE